MSDSPGVPRKAGSNPSLDDIVDEIRRARPLGPFVVAIEGRGGAGKTTVAHALAVRVADSAVVAMDDFLVKERILDDRVENHYDLSRVVREVLIPFRQGLAINYRRLDWNSNTLVPIEGIIDSTLILLEGICAYCPPLDDDVDLRIWVETPADVATKRGRLRDLGTQNESNWDVWQRQDDDYLTRVKPRVRADFIVSGV